MVIYRSYIGHRHLEIKSILSVKIKQRSLLTFIDSDAKRKEKKKKILMAFQTNMKPASCFIRIKMTVNKELRKLGSMPAGV